MYTTKLKSLTFSAVAVYLQSCQTWFRQRQKSSLGCNSEYFTTLKALMSEVFLFSLKFGLALKLFFFLIHVFNSNLLAANFPNHSSVQKSHFH